MGVGIYKEDGLTLVEILRKIYKLKLTQDYVLIIEDRGLERSGKL